MANHDTESDMNIDKSDALERVEKEKVAAVDDAANSSEDEGELLPKVVENYYFTDENQEPINITVLPVDMDGDEIKDGSNKQVFLEGTADGGLQKVYKQAIAWKLNLQEQKPVICAMIKERAWIQLQKPRKSYEEIIRTFLVTSHFLHFAGRNPEASEKAHWDHLRKIFSSSDYKPSESDLLEHSSLIEGLYQRDQKLQKSDVLKKIVEMKSRKRKTSDEDVDVNPKAKRTKFLVSDAESDGDLGDDGLDESDEEEEDLFDSVCAICDNGGELLCCEGPCMRSFHPNREAGEDSSCKSLGLTKTQIKEIQNFYCLNCKYKQHQCFVCGELGSSDKSSGAQVFCCVSATCGRFYHPQCISKLIVPEAEVEEFEKKIAEGLQFTCPVHRCYNCKQTEQKEDEDLQFAICRRCPRAFHRKCLPKSITFEETDDEPQRAWDDLIPNRILIYCRKHKIDPDLGTPRRNHIKFPEVPSTDKVIKRNRVVSPESGVGKRFEKRIVKTPDSIKEKGSADSIKGKVPRKSSEKKEKSTLGVRDTALPKVRSAPELPKKALKEMGIPLLKRKEDKYSTLEPKKGFGQKESKSKDLDLSKSKTVKGLISPKGEQKNPTVVLPSITENDVKSTIMDIVERSTTGVTLDYVFAKHQMPSSHRSFSRNLDKSITQGKVEGSVEAVRTALKKLEEGGSLDDAKAVCGPDILSQMLKWKNKLKVYLAPFLHGKRYTSFGRHFTKVDKLQEVVERLHWYVQNGDTIVDFCCGANDFSRLMKAKLEQSGKKCFYKNFDIIQPKNDFEFEKRDWFTVRKNELPTGTRLIMGLNPPFGVKAALANKFIDKALEFLPKLIVLIVPRETKRLDEKPERYDLVWEDLELLKGESFYMPGSVDVDDNQLGQWNTVAPPLYLWSRPDWSAKHKAIGIKQGHLKDYAITTETQVSDIKPTKDEQGYAFGHETINKPSVDFGENVRESKPETLSFVHRKDDLKQRDVLSNKLKEEQRESQSERDIPDKKNLEQSNSEQRIYEAQRKDKDSDMHDSGRDRFEQNHMHRQERGDHDGEYGHQKHQKEMSPARERADHVERDRPEKGRQEKGKNEVDKSEKERPEREKQIKDRKRERPDRGKLEKERMALSPPLKKLEVRQDDEIQYKSYMQDHGSLHTNATDGFGRPFERGPGNREDHARGLQIGANELGQEIGVGFQGMLPGAGEEGYGRGYHRMSGGGEDGFGRVHRDVSEDLPGAGEEGYGRGYHRMSGGGEDGFGRVHRGVSEDLPGAGEEGYGRGYHRMPGGGEDGFGRVHRGVSEDYGRVKQHGRSGNLDEEYHPAEVNRGFTRNFPGLESEYSVSPDLQMMQNRVYNRQAQHDYDSERSRLLQDTRAPDWLMGDSQRSRYYIEQTSHVNNAYVPEMNQSLRLGQQYEEPSHLHSRGPYHSEPYERSELTSSAMHRYTPRLDENMNYSRASLSQVEPPPRSGFFGTGQVRGSQSLSFDPLAFAPGPQNPYSHQSSSGWLDE